MPFDSVAPFDSGTPFDSVVASSPTFVLLPTVVTAPGVVSVTATGIGTAWNGSTPWAISSGPASGLTDHVNVDAGSATFDITVTALSGPIVITDGTLNFSIEASLAFSRVVAVPMGTVAAGTAYRVLDFTGALTGWITTGMTIVPGTTAFAINAGIAQNNADVSFSGILEFRSQEASPTYVRQSLNLYIDVPRGATLRATSVHTFLPGDTVVEVGVRVFSNNSGTDADDIAHTTTGVVTISETDKCYTYDVVVPTHGYGGFHKFIVWDYGGASVVRDLNSVVIPRRVTNVGNVPFWRDVTFPLGVTPTSVKWLARKIVAGVLTDVGTWSAAGVSATTGMTASATQPAGYTINSSVTPNNPDGSFSGILLVRSADSTPAYRVQTLNIQARGSEDPVITTEIAPLFEIDEFEELGRRAYHNSAGVLTALEARQTVDIAIPEIENGYCTELSFSPDTDGGREIVLLWDLDEATYFADLSHFDAPASTIASTAPNMMHMIKMRA